MVNNRVKVIISNANDVRPAQNSDDRLKAFVAGPKFASAVAFLSAVSFTSEISSNFPRSHFLLSPLFFIKKYY